MADSLTIESKYKIHSAQAAAIAEKMRKRDNTLWMYLFRTRFVYQFDHLISFPSTKIYWMTSFESMCACVGYGAMAITSRSHCGHDTNTHNHFQLEHSLANLDGRGFMWNFSRSYQRNCLIDAHTVHSHTSHTCVAHSRECVYCWPSRRFGFHKMLYCVVYARNGPER